MQEQEEAGSRGTGLGDNLDAVVVDEAAAHSQGEVADSCTGAAHPDLPGLGAVHEPRKALAVVDRFGLADHLDLRQGHAHWARKAQMPGQKPLVTKQDGRGIAG